MSQLKIISLDNLKYIMNYLKTKFTAPMASCDAAGNNIQETYLKKTEKAADAVHADDAERAARATSAVNATNDALGREISKTYVSAAGGKVEGELHVQQPADNDRSDKPATTSWTANLLAHTLPSKKEDGTLQTWDINVSGNAKTADDATHAANADAAKEADHAKAADTANAVAWDGVSGKPAAYPPAAHDHDSVYVKKDEASKAIKFTNGTCIESADNTVMIGMQPMNGDKNKAAMWFEKDDTTTPVNGKPRAAGGFMTWNDGIRTCDSRLTLGEYPAQAKTNSISFCDKDGKQFSFLQATAHPDRYAATWLVFNDVERKNGAYLNLHMCKNGVRMIGTNCVVQAPAFNMPTSDNGWGNFWIT